MLDMIPNEEEMTDLVGKSLYDIWNQLCAVIDENYDMDCLWSTGGKAYARENCVGFMIVLVKDERLKFETDRENYSKEVQEIYDEAQIYHDGKWIMFEPVDTSLFHDFIRLLRMKRKPNKK